MASSIYYPPPNNPPIAIGGVRFDHVSMSETLNRIEAMVCSGQSHYVVTPNVDFVMQAQTDAELRRILFEADLSICDGTPLLWASGLLGNPLPERVAGSDLVPALLKVAAQKAHRVFFLGGTSKSSELAVARVREQYPQLKLAGHFSPPFADLLDMDLDEIRTQIRLARPDLLFVSFGSPKGEKWIRLMLEELRVPVSISVGATLDFLAGTVARAPRWMRRTGTEWLFRVIQEPRRLTKRYLTGFWVVGRVLARQCWHMRETGSVPATTLPALPTQSESPDRCDWKLPPRWDAAAVKAAWSHTGNLLADLRPTLIDLSEVSIIDSTGLGWLMHVQSIARRRGKRLVCAGATKELAGLLDTMRVRESLCMTPDLASAFALLHSPSPAPDASVQSAPDPEGLRLQWTGHVSAENAKQVWTCSESQLRDGLPAGKTLVLDLAALRYLDSSGALVLMRLNAWCLEHRGRLRMINIHPDVRTTLVKGGRADLLKAGST